MEYKDIEAKVKEFLIDTLEIEEEKIAPEARLQEDMSIGSLEVVDVVVFVESEFGFKMEPREFKDIKTFTDFCKYIEGRLNA